MIINFIQNSALLISLSVLYGLIKWYKPQNEILYQVSQGVWFGAVAITAMMMPYAYSPGVIYDGRSVVLTLAGLFGGGYTALVSVLIAGAYRIYLGGSGIWAGLATILFSSLTGLFFRRLFKSKLENIQFIRFILIGVVAHLVMLASQLLLPDNERYEVISLIWLPVLLVLPVTFAVIAKFFQLIGRYIQSEQKIREAESLYRTTLLSIGDAVICTDKKGNISQMNTVAEQLTGWKFAEAKEKKLDQIFRIINEGTRKEVESPYTKVLQSGSIVGLANHTLLISKDGREIPIADSGAPIKNEKGEITGVVLVFRDQTEEREYQEKIAQSEAQYRELVESTDAIAWEYDILIDKWVYVAPQVTDKLGWLPEEWTNLDFWKNNLHPEEQESAAHYCFACAAKGESHTLEYRFKCKNDTYIWLRDVVAVEMHDNQPVKLRGVMFDITERKNMEIRLREREFWLTESQRIGKIGSYDFNIIGNCWSSSEVLDEIFGITNDNPRTLESWNAIIHPDHQEEMLDYFLNSVVKKRKPFDKDYKITRGNDGAERWVLGRGELTFDETGNPVRMFGTIMDITERKLFEQQLLESEERFRKAVLLAPIPMMVHDEDGNVINLSEGWNHFSGYNIEDIPTLKDWTEKAFGEKAQEVENYVAGMFDENKTIFSGEFEIISKSGEKRIWNFYTTPLGTLSSGKRIMLSMAPDVTQRKKVQNELIEAKEKAEESERLKTAFLSNMSHEIRTPLNGILGFTTLLAEDDNLSQESKKEYAFIINKSSEGLLKIINDILDISRLETEKAGIEQKPFDAGITLSTIDSIFQKKLGDAGNNNVELIVKKPDTPLVLNADETRLIQIFSNLLDNALRFTSKGSVTFGISRLNKNNVEFFVADTGVGIPKEKHEIIFDRFSQADNTMTRSYGGTGLGLAIVKKLLELMGSTIVVESEPGEGTCFRFHLPCAATNENEDNISDPGKGNSLRAEKSKILVVEDDSTSRHYFNQILCNHYPKLFFAKSGKEALHFFETQNPDIILMDIELPDMNGLEIVRKIRETNINVFIIAQTAYAMPGDDEKALEAGCNDYIAKPIRKALLLKKLRQFNN